MRPDDINAYYYAKNFGKNAMPPFYFKRKFKRLQAYRDRCDQAYLQKRLDYYLKLDSAFQLPEDAVAAKNFKRTKGTGYYLDLKEFLHYFSPDARFTYHFGDELHINPYPTLFKARPLNDKNANSVLFKLNKRRHFRWVSDSRTFEQKKDMVVWRGRSHQKQRRYFVEKYWENPTFDVGLTDKLHTQGRHLKGFMDIKTQLEHKFIACIEGYDVATNLKWAMSSNSLCIMPKPTCETWFMEGTLEAEKHYVEVKNDFSDMEEKMQYYIRRPKEAQAIIANAHRHVAQFKNRRTEDLLCFMVLEKYFELSGQTDFLRFCRP
ncbi:glycosyl transferase family 90 [Pseudozobellia thermophila]|uniref:Glycosyl transferase family 90 n=1 Tax=Pseudozobellia thermophila TaxID=192903 RepID=A0A1M6BVJ4_9FLAO|nr:glycosyl transferase family 90 [Pseudozobellia thermophila]SHI52780.1 Glycosyl transferase family 90 [Pseudozobellia thermophila]